MLMAGAAVRCLPNPTKDFDDFLDRTSASRDATAAVCKDGTAPTTPFSALYVAFCITQFSADDPERVFRFYTKVDYLTSAPAPTTDSGASGTTDASGSSDASDDSGDAMTTSSSSGSNTVDATAPVPMGPAVSTIKLQITALLARDAAGIRQPPATVSQSLTNGATINGQSGVSADGKFKVALGTLAIKDIANAVNPRDVNLANIVMEGQINDPLRFFSNLGGQLTAPVMADLDPAQNSCVFIQVKEGDPLPATPTFKCQ